MNRIYRSAQQVIVHLGDEQNADTAVSFVNRLYFHYNFKDSQVLSRVIGPNEFDLAGLIRRRLPAFLNDAHMWEAWEKLATNHYWQRLWIIQECAVAQSLVAVYGGTLVAWYLLPFSAAIFAGTSVDLALRSEIAAIRNLATSTAHSALISLMHLRLIYAKQDAAQSIWELAIVARNSKSKEPQDKVFGLLGMSQQAQVPYLQPDGRKSLCEIYGSVVQAGLEGGSFLTFCVSGLSSRRDDSMPSWIPNLANPPSIDTMRYHERSEHKALGASEPAFEISSDWQQLKIQGVHVGTIAVKAPDPIDEQLLETLGLSALDATQLGIRMVFRLLQLRNIFDSHISLDEMAEPERTQVFWQTVTDDFDGRAPRPQAEQAQILHALEQGLFQIAQLLEDSRELMGGDPMDQVPLEQFVSVISSLTSTTMDAQNVTLAEFATKSFDLIAESDVFKDILLEIVMSMYAISISTLVITEDKKVALVPAGTQLNDVIVVFDGSPVPHILRPKEGRDGLYELVGEAYVYEITKCFTTDTLRSWFVLC